VIIGQGGGDHPANYPKTPVSGKVWRCTALGMAVIVALTNPISLALWIKVAVTRWCTTLTIVVYTRHASATPN
jgi:hypothetical protein